MALEIKSLQLIRPAGEGGELNATIEAGSAVVVVGRNGAGKSTLLQTLAGLLPPKKGQVLWDGQDVRLMGPELRASCMAVVASTPPRESRMTVSDVIELGLRAGGHMHDLQAVRTAMETAGIDHWSQLPLSSLSDGMAQRVMMARAAAQGKGMLLLDEPTAFLDVVGRREVLSQMGDWSSEGRILWLATHDLEGVEAAGWSTHWLHLHPGRKQGGTFHKGPFVAEKARQALVLDLNPKERA